MEKEKNNLLHLIISELTLKKIKNRRELDNFKRAVAKQYKIDCPNNIQLLAAYRQLVKEKKIKEDKGLEEILRTRPVRSLSGIVNVSVLTKPYPCPGQCIYCPEEKGVPKSYLKGEPAVQRAMLADFDPYRQVSLRLESLEAIGHPIDKIELRIIGGTWSYYPEEYQEYFIKECLQAANDFRKSREKGKNSRKKNERTLAEIEKENERAQARVIGITVETRPDYISKKEIRQLRLLGITRVELGVQSIYNSVLKLNKRGHGLVAITTATKLLKEAGFKISYQMMPNLPGSNLKKDEEMFEKLFSDDRLKPDLLKIYPLALVKEAPLYEWYRKKKFQPYDKEELINLLIRIKKKIPYWVRIQRIIRDIPAQRIVAGGVKISNLREIVQARLAEAGNSCHCIRCREIKGAITPEDIKEMVLFRDDYLSAEGKEIFLSFENKKRTKLYGLLRLRIRAKKEKEIFPILKNSALIREIHTYGQMIPVGEKSESAQHQGLGKQLMNTAETIVKKEFPTIKRIAVIAGVGVRDYYRHLGYYLEDSYMVKEI
jgi:elongator complex protein 3